MKTALVFTSNMGGKRQWQTIVKTIRLVASKVEVNKLQAVKVVTRKPAADKPSRVVSKVASRVVSAAKANRAASRVASRAAVLDNNRARWIRQSAGKANLELIRIS